MEYIQFMLDALAEIPDVIWSGLLASAVTLSGVLIADSRNTKRADRKNTFDAEQNAIERNISARKDVYLPAAAALAEAQGALAGMIDDHQRAVDCMNTVAGCAAKIALISTPESARQMQKCMTNLSKIYLALTIEVVQRSELKAQIEAEDKRSVLLQANFDEVRGQIDRGAAAGDSEQELQLFYQRSTEISKRLTECLNRCVELSDRMLEEKIKFSRVAMAGVLASSNDAVKLLSLLREELGQEGNFNELASATAQTNADMEDALASFYKVAGRPDVH